MWLLVYIAALLATIAIELAIAWFLCPHDRARLRVDVPVLNAFTHPLATIAVLSGGLPLFGVEVCVFLAELLGFRFVTRLSWGRATALSFVANAATTIVAVWLRAG